MLRERWLPNKYRASSRGALSHLPPLPDSVTSQFARQTVSYRSGGSVGLSKTRSGASPDGIGGQRGAGARDFRGGSGDVGPAGVDDVNLVERLTRDTDAADRFV